MSLMIWAHTLHMGTTEHARIECEKHVLGHGVTTLPSILPQASLAAHALSRSCRHHWQGEAEMIRLKARGEALEVHMLNDGDPSASLADLYLAPEDVCLAQIQAQLSMAPSETEAVHARARDWIARVRLQPPPLLARLLQDYQLSTQEGWALMCLAECLWRIPDRASAYDFAGQMLAEGRWQGGGDALTRISSWLLRRGRDYASSASQGWHQLLHRFGDEVFLHILQATLQAMAQRFVFAEDISTALAHRHPDLLYTFDMLGESAVSDSEAERHLNDYALAISALSASRRSPCDGVSIKISALYPRCEPGQAQRALPELEKRCLWLAEQAAAADLPLTLDAEESASLELSLRLLARLRQHPHLQGWDGLGIAVQAYQRRASAVIGHLQQLAERSAQPLKVRLVKGAYWDREIQLAQQLGLASYPVFTAKRHSDLSYLACARQLLASPYLQAQFATHNAHTLACLSVWAAGRPIELQRLHGMSEALHTLVAQETGLPVRVYAPIGRFRELLPYLIRRMLENGSHQSFVARLYDESCSDDDILGDPLLPASTAAVTLPEPRALWPGRPAAAGFSLADKLWLQRLRLSWSTADDVAATPLPPHLAAGPAVTVFSRACPEVAIGNIRFLDDAGLAAATDLAAAAARDWGLRPVHERAACLRSMAQRLEDTADDYLRLLLHEGGKVLMDAQAELREAIDLCRYYADQGEQLMQARPLDHITGEANTLHWRARGLVLCISPWNFPLAIFLGQVAAALVTGNSVIAKPASATPLLAYRACLDLHAAGVPEAVLIHAPCPAAALTTVLAHPDLAAVAFTGSTSVAQSLHRQLAEQHRAILPLIAETGGLNALIADSTALPEQVVRDLLVAAFNSNGQRCSSCRILFVQDSIAERVETLLAGALQHWIIDSPLALSSDAGPLIDAAAQASLLAYESDLAKRCACIGRAAAPSHGCYMGAVAYACRFEDLPTEEVFGPILHCVRFQRDDWPRLIAWLRQSGYGLTLGLHTRQPGRAAELAAQIPIGNVYVNRPQIGAAVAQQPFGGRGLSGTGFKAGGPHYLMRFAVEQVVCDNLAALGIDPELVQFGAAS